MAEIISYRCDRCAVTRFNAEEVALVTFRPSEAFSLSTEDIHLCEDCEQALKVWLEGGPAHGDEDDEARHD